MATQLAGKVRQEISSHCKPVPNSCCDRRFHNYPLTDVLAGNVVDDSNAVLLFGIHPYREPTHIITQDGSPSHHNLAFCGKGEAIVYTEATGRCLERTITSPRDLWAIAKAKAGEDKFKQIVQGEGHFHLRVKG